MNSIRTFFQGNIGVRILKNFPLILAILTTLFFSLGGWGQVNTFTTAGSGTIAVPAGAISATIECLGGGGGGGGGGSAGYSAGGAGGGGAYSKVTIAVSPGLNIAYFVGNGGAGATGGSGANGQTSTATYNSLMVCSAQGGFGGVGPSSGAGTGGAGGSSGIGYLYSGGNGGNGKIGPGPSPNDYDSGGAGGGGAGSTGNGNNGANGSGSSAAASGGTGGTGGFTSGTGGNGCSTYTSCGGVAGNTYGAGGGGGSGYSSGSGWGGNGARGKIVITFCVMSVTTQPSTSIQNLCVGGASTALTIAGTGITTYQWYSNTTASNTGGTLISGATTSSYTPPTASSGTKYYYCIVGNGTCTLNSNVSGAINVGVASIVAGSSTILCGGGSVTLTASAQGATSYLWSNGATSNSITVSPTANTTYSVTVNSTCGSVTQSILVKYSPPLTFTATATADNLNGYSSGSGYTSDILNLNSYPVQATLLDCGFDGSLTGSIGGTWTTSTSGTAGTCSQAPAISTAASDSYLGAPGSTVYPYVGSGMLKYNSGYTVGTNSGTVTSAAFSTVGYTGIIVDYYLLQFVNSSCGENITLQYSTNGSTWNTIANQTRAGGSVQCPSWMNFSYELPAGALGQASVQIRFVFTGGGCTCGQDLLLDAVRVTGVTVAGGYGFYSTYSWTQSGTGPAVSIVNPAIRSTNTADLDATGTGYLTFTSTMTDGNGCVYTASDIVNMNPNSSGGSSGSATATPSSVCSGGSSTITLAGVGNSGIQWQYSTTSSTGPWTDIAGATSPTYNASNINVTTWYRIRFTSQGALSGSCQGSLSSAVAVVTVSTFNNGIIQNTGETVGCGGDPGQFGFTTLPSGSGSYSVQWYAYNGSTTAPTGSTVPVGWTAVGGPVSSTVTVIPTETFTGASLPAGWSFGATPATIGTTCGGGSSNSINFNTGTSPWGQSVTSLAYSAPVISLSFVHGASGTCCSTRTSTLTVEAWNGSSWTLVTGGTVSQSSTGTGGCNSSVKSFSFSSALNYTQFRVRRTAGTATKVTVDDWNVTTQTNISYNPPAPASATTTYAAYVTFSGGACTNSGWATNSWIVNFTGGGTSTDWTGAALDWNWFNSANWSCGIPVCGIDANIPVVGNATYPKIDNANGSGASCKNITIASGASLETVGTANLDVCGNWVKDGTYSYNTGKISMVGTVAQTMSPATSFYNLTINNTGAGVTISADQTVTNVLTLIDGVVTTAANRMIISNNPAANVVYSGTNPSNYSNSWINGNLRRSFATNTGVYDFPVGCASYSALARLTNGSLTGISVMDAYYVQTLTTATPLDPTKAIDFGTPYTSCFTDGYWFLEPSTGSVTGGNYNLKLYYNGWSSINSSYDNKYGMVKRPTSTPTSMAWSTQIPTDGAGTLNAANGSGRVFASGYAERNNMTMFSHFAIAYALAPLPIELVEFNGKYADRFNLLEWKTASEHNNDYFTLEGSSNGQDWTKVAEMNGSGNSTDMLSYFFEDYKYVQNSFNYYRLSQTDFDGTVKMAGNVISIDNRNNVRTIVRMTNILGQDVPPNAKGMLIYIYDDGSQEKVYIE